MNAADQRRLTPFLAGACVLAAALLATMASGVGTSVHWGRPKSSPRVTALAASVTAPQTRTQPLAAYAVVWQRPLFNQARQPVPTSGNANGQRVSLGDLQLTGIILTPGLHMALMHDRKAGRDIRVREGAAVPNGNWVLHDLKPRQAVFVDGGKRTTLVLKVPGGQGQGAVQPNPNARSARAASAGSPANHTPPARSHSQLTMRPARPAPASSHDGTAAAQNNNTRMQAIKARIKKMRRQRRARRDKDGDGS